MIRVVLNQQLPIIVLGRTTVLCFMCKTIKTVMLNTLFWSRLLLFQGDFKAFPRMGKNLSRSVFSNSLKAKHR